MSEAAISVPLLDLRAQYETIKQEARQAIDKVCDSQGFILGPEVEALEQEVAHYSQAEFGIGVSSGTDALIVALLAAGIKEGDEVITTPYTFFATASSIARVGAKPVFVDIEPLSVNINPDLIEERITPKTKAIMPVHLFGQCADMRAISDLAQRYNLAVIEDACQAIGAEFEGRRAGTLGTMACFSFFPSKNLGGFGDGGMVTTNNPELAQLLKSLRMHGEVQRYYHKYLGGNFRLDALQAAVLRVKLPHLDGWAEKRRSNAKIYHEQFSEAGISVDYDYFRKSRDKTKILLPQEVVTGRHIYNQFVIRSHRRDELMKYLQERKIGCQIYYPVGLHCQECFSYLGYNKGDFKETETATEETLALPIYPELSRQQIEYVAETITDFCRR